MLPDIYFFNPTCELAIANESPYYTAPAGLRQFEAALGYLPGWLAEEKDQVLVSGILEPAFRERMRSIGFNLPEFLGLEMALADPEWLARPKGRIFPWGWSPAAGRLLKDVMPSCSADFRQSAAATWKKEHKLLYSRLTAGSMLENIIGEHVQPWLPPRSALPVACYAQEQIWQEIARHKKSVVKTPWSSSGRGLLLFPNIDSRGKNDELLTGMLRQQGFVTVEPWHDKVVDLSFQFNSSGGKISFVGHTFFETDRKGRYIRTFLKDKAGQQENIREFLDRHISRVAALLTGSLQQSAYTTLYEGWLGVDAIVYRAEDESLRFHPAVEINGRFTMGAIAMKLRQHLAAGSDGYFQVFYSKSSNFRTFCLAQEQQNPLVMRDGKIVSGFMPLTPPLPENHSGAWMEVVVL